MPGTPKTKASELIDKLNDLLHQEERDEFTLRKIKKEAENLMSSDAFNAYILLGMLASLENDVDAMRKNYLAALKLRPNDWDANFNYSTSLNNLCFVSEAREYAEKAYNGNRGNLTSLSFLIEISLKSGRIREARKWLKHFQALSPEEVNEDESLILEAHEMVVGSRVSDEYVEQLLELSFSIMRRNDITPKNFEIEILTDEESRWLNFTIEVPRPPAEVVNLDFEAAEQLAKSKIPTQVTDAVIVTFSSEVD